MRILTFDPGGTIGWSMFQSSVTSPLVMECVDAGHLATLEEAAFMIRGFGVGNDRKHVVYEGFARGNTAVADQLMTIEICGGIRASCALNDLSVSMQYPAQRTGYIPIAKKMVQSWGKTLKEYHHAIDAMAHAINYMEKNNLDWSKQYWLKQL